MGHVVKEQALTRYDLWTAQECFLTGTAAEVIPCVEVDHRLIGDGIPGPVTRILMEKFKERVKTRRSLCMKCSRITKGSVNFTIGMSYALRF